MTDTDWITRDRARTVWRYMGFSRFAWLLQRKQLWLSRADKLGDPWEIALAGEQLDHLVKRNPSLRWARSARRRWSELRGLSRLGARRPS